VAFLDVVDLEIAVAVAVVLAVASVLAGLAIGAARV
jgi:hypothetical protein